MTDSMRPSQNWGDAAKQFGAATQAQVLLCVTCMSTGEVPGRVVVYDGNSYCVAHAIEEVTRRRRDV